MINVEEVKDGDDYIFASDLHFEATGRIVTRVSELTCKEQRELLIHMFRKLEGAYNESEAITKTLGKALGWENVV